MPRSLAVETDIPPLRPINNALLNSKRFKIQGVRYKFLQLLYIHNHNFHEKPQINVKNLKMYALC